MGRAPAKREIITDSRIRRMTMSKRMHGIIKKGMDLYKMCDAEVQIKIVHNEGDTNLAKRESRLNNCDNKRTMVVYTSNNWKSKTEPILLVQRYNDEEYELVKSRIGGAYGQSQHAKQSNSSPSCSPDGAVAAEAALAEITTAEKAANSVNTKEPICKTIESEVVSKKISPCNVFIVKKVRTKKPVISTIKSDPVEN